MGRNTDAVLAAESDTMAHHYAQLAALAACPGKKTLSIMLIDESESMKDYVRTVKDSANRHLEKIKSPPDGSAQYCMMVATNSRFHVVVRLSPAKDAPAMTDYRPRERTLLYHPYYLLIKGILRFFEKLTPSQRDDLHVIFCVFTDGEDNESDDAKYPAKLQRMVADAISLGFEFFTFGFRRDAITIAKEMGCPTDAVHAVTEEKSDAGIERAFNHATSVTTTFWYDPRRDTSAKPTS